MRTNGDRTADPTDDRTADPTSVPTETLTVAEAAEALGITTEAARMRVKRGTLPSTRIDGTVYVLVDRPNPRPHGPNAGPNDQPNAGPNGSVGVTNGHPDAGNPAASALLAAKDETIGALREQLEAERQANRENRRIIAGLIERVPELPPKQHVPLSPMERADDEEGHRETAGETTRPNEVRQSWWRRVFGG